MENILREIYIIEELNRDTYENDHRDALFYKPVGYVASRKEAEQIVTDGGTLPEEWCWAMNGRMNKYRFKILKQFKTEKLKEQL